MSIFVSCVWHSSTVSIYECQRPSCEFGKKAENKEENIIDFLWVFICIVFYVCCSHSFLFWFAWASRSFLGYILLTPLKCRPLGRIIEKWLHPFEEILTGCRCATVTRYGLWIVCVAECEWKFSRLEFHLFGLGGRGVSHGTNVVNRRRIPNLAQKGTRTHMTFGSNRKCDHNHFVRCLVLRKIGIDHVDPFVSVSKCPVEWIRAVNWFAISYRSVEAISIVTNGRVTSISFSISTPEMIIAKLVWMNSSAELSPRASTV